MPLDLLRFSANAASQRIRRGLIASGLRWGEEDQIFRRECSVISGTDDVTDCSQGRVESALIATSEYVANEAGAGVAGKVLIASGASVSKTGPALRTIVFGSQQPSSAARVARFEQGLGSAWFCSSLQQAW